MSIKFPNLKRFFSLFLAAVMMVSLLAVNAHAANANKITDYLDAYRAPHQNRVPVGASEITGIMDTLEDIAHDLRHLRTGDLALGVQPSITVTADVAPLYHGCNRAVGSMGRLRRQHQRQIHCGGRGHTPE